MIIFEHGTWRALDDHSHVDVLKLTMSARLGNGLALGPQERLTERSVEDFGSWFLDGPCGDAKDLP